MNEERLMESGLRLSEYERAREVARSFEIFNDGDPNIYGTTIQDVVAWHNSKITQLATVDTADRLDLQVSVQDTVRDGRPLYHQEIPEEIQYKIGLINNLGVVNRGLVNLNDEPTLRMAGESGLHAVNTVIAVPCMPAESTTAHDIALYVREVMRDKTNRILFVNAREHKSITDAVAGVAPMINQSEIMEEVDWVRMIDAGIIPHHFPLIRNERNLLVPDTSVGVVHRKGITMHAAQMMFIALQGEGILPQEEPLRMLGHDGDITDPRQYLALEHLGLGFLQDPNGLPNILRSGEGRNNESWIQGTNFLKLDAALAMRRRALIEHNHLTPMEKQQVETIHRRNGITGEEIDTLMKIGYSLGAWGWPLTGEREFSPYGLTSTGMDLETTISVRAAMEDAVIGRRNTIQICNPNPKLENGTSSPKREHSLIYGCTNWQKTMVQHAMMIDRPPHLWETAEIEIFNKLYGGTPTPLSVRGDTPDQPNETTISNLGFVLPSAQFMYQNGFVNSDNILQKWHNRNARIVS